MAFAEAKAPFLRSNLKKSKNQKLNETQGEAENEKLPPEIRRQLSLRNKAFYAFCRAVLPGLFAFAFCFLHLAPAFSLPRKP